MKSTATRLSNLRDFLAAKNHQESLRLYLHSKQGNLLQQAVLVTLYRKWSSRPPYGLTEIGIATYDRQQVKCGLPCPPGPHAEALLRNIWSIHLRLRTHAHLPSENASPDAFHFGSSVFVTHPEAMCVLYQIWHQPMDAEQPEKGFRPIICLSYGDNDALGKVRVGDFDFSPSAVDTTISVLNAQDIAVQAKITSSANATIDYILSILKITAFGIGNAGNAATYINIIAFLSVLRDEIYGEDTNPRAKPGQKGISSSKSAQSVMQWLMERPTPAPPFGVTTYCSRCSSFVHSVAECPNTDMVCRKCLASKEKWRKENAATHREAFCVFRQ